MTFGKQCKKEFFFRDLSTFCKLGIKFLQTGMEASEVTEEEFVSMKLDVSFIRFFLSLAWLENYWLNFTGNRQRSRSAKKILLLQSRVIIICSRIRTFLRNAFSWLNLLSVAKYLNVSVSIHPTSLSPFYDILLLWQDYKWTCLQGFDT